MIERKIILSNTTNTRELGGYCNKAGRKTNYKAFLRSDDISGCNQDDIKKLLDYGVKTIIDLRSGSELIKRPNVFAANQKVKYHHIPLIPEVHFNAITGPTAIAMEQAYIEMIKNHSAVYQVFHTLATSGHGTVLFHCTAGKDRTGVTALLLMMLADIALEQIVADYQLTAAYIQPLIETLAQTYPEIPLHVMECQPQWITAAFHYIVHTHDGIDGYLRSIGLDDAAIASVRNILIAQPLQSS